MILSLNLKIRGFLRLRIDFSKTFEVFWGWGLHWSYEGYEVSTSINFKTPGEDEVKIFEVFWGILKKPRKINKKDWKILLTCLKIWGFSRIVENFHLRLTLKNPQKLRWGWGQHFWGWGWKFWGFLGRKDWGFLRIKPQKPSNFEVRMRPAFLRNFTTLTCLFSGLCKIWCNLFTLPLAVSIFWAL